MKLFIAWILSIGLFALPWIMILQTTPMKICFQSLWNPYADYASNVPKKSIKAVYLALPNYKDGYPRSHDIDFLLNQIKGFVRYDEEFKFYSVLLTSFKGKFNYPSNIELDEAMTKKGLEYAREIHDWAKEVVYQKRHIINHHKGFSR